MEYINHLNNNELIWDDKYFDIDLSIDDCTANLYDVINLLVLIIHGMNKEIIDTKFYYLGAYIAKVLRPFTSAEQRLTNTMINMLCDPFSSPEKILETYSGPMLFASNRRITSFHEYVIVTKSMINYDLESCIPFMHQVDLNNTSILDEYNNVRDRLHMKNQIGCVLNLNTESP